jgi:hypothetical protein
MRENFANGKIILGLFFAAFFALVVCLGVYFVAAPKLNVMATDTLSGRTQSAIENTKIAETQTSQAVESQKTQYAEETLTAAPTPTFPPTPIPSSTNPPTLTPTASLTPTPELSACSAPPTGSIYPLPSKAFKPFVTSTNRSATVLAQADRTGWYLVKYENNQLGWINIENLKLTNCVPTSAPIELLTGWNKDGARVFMDDFFTDYGWKTSEKDISAITRDKRTFVLPLSGEQAQQAYLRSQSFDLTDSFSMYASYALIRANKYFGVRFWDDGVNYYELRATIDCNLELYNGEDFLSRRPALTKQNCYAGFQNYFAAKVFKDPNGQLILSASLNESPYIDFLLPAQYTGKKFSWVWGLGSQVEVEYFLLLK